jgi:hypothetical protein
VLRFYGYFKEAVVESNMENHRIRKVIIYYYLEDDSMHVAEPRQDNSGIPQVCRHDPCTWQAARLQQWVGCSVGCCAACTRETGVQHVSCPGCPLMPASAS